MNDDLRSMIEETKEKEIDIKENQINEADIDKDQNNEEEVKEETKIIKEKIIEDKEEEVKEETKIIKEKIIEDKEDSIIDDIPEKKYIVEELPKEKLFLCPFNKWIRDNIKNIDNTKMLGIQTSGVDLEKTIILKTLDHRGGFAPDGEPLHRLIVFENSDKIRIFDRPCIDMKVITSDCTNILYDMYGEKTTKNSYVLRSYRMKSFITCVLNYIIDDMIIPVYVQRVTQKEEYLSIPEISYDQIVNKINQSPDKEGIEINYKQFGKVKENMKTTNDILKWFADKKESIVDINHLIYIDKMIAKYLTT